MCLKLSRVSVLWIVLYLMLLSLFGCEVVRSLKALSVLSLLCVTRVLSSDYRVLWLMLGTLLLVGE